LNVRLFFPAKRVFTFLNKNVRHCFGKHTS